MKIVDRAAFLKMSENTLFSYYAPKYFSGLCVKLETSKSGNDFYYQDLIGNVKSESDTDFIAQTNRLEAGESIDFDFDCSEREGLYREAQMFMIYEPTDLLGLYKTIIKCATSHPDFKK